MESYAFEYKRYPIYSISISRLIMRPKRFFYIPLVVLLIAICFSNCVTVDPINPQNTYSIDNLTPEDIKVAYTILPEHIFWERPARSFTDTCFVFANTTTQLPLNKYGFYVSECPSRLFERIVILSADNDTLKLLFPIDDTLWQDSISVSDYGYIVRNHNWLYEFTE